MIHAVRNINPTTFEVRPVQRTAHTTNNVINRNTLTYLVKFTNDMNDRTIYAYPKGYTTTDGIVDFGLSRSNYQYSEITFQQNCAGANVYQGLICLKPAGFWYYEICEVYFANGITITWEEEPFDCIAEMYAPFDFTGDLDVWDEEGPNPETYGGVLGVIVEEGKLQVKEVPTEVTYIQYEEPATNNYIYNGE